MTRERMKKNHNPRNLLSRIMVFLLLALVTNTWAVCQDGFVSDQNGPNPTVRIGGANVSQSGSVSLGGQYNCRVNWVGTSTTSYAAKVRNYRSWCGDATFVNNVSLNFIYCTTKAEADSVECENKSGWKWESGKCVDHNCTQPDSTWGACATIFQRDSNGLQIPVTQVRKYSRVNCVTEETSRETFYNKTCDQYFSPDSSKVKCHSTFGTTVYLENEKGQVFPCPDVDGSCQTAQIKYMDGGCQPPNLPNPVEPPSGGGDPFSSSSTDLASSSSVDTAGIPIDIGWLKDSMYMVDTNFLQVRSQLEYIGADVRHNTQTTDELLLNSYTQNSLLRDIANKDYTINLNVPRDTIANNVNVNVENPVYKDSAVTSRLDSILSKMGQGGSDTSGLGGIVGQIDDIIAGLGNSVDSIKFTWMDGLDTAGGKDNSATIIGTDGLEKAQNGTRAAFGELKDSLTGGAIADSLDKWADGFKNNKLSGSGSENCPAVLKRTYQIPLGVTTMTIGPLGKYMCEPILGSVTPWRLARLLLRTIIAFACMMWIFRQATGTMSGEDE